MSDAPLRGPRIIAGAPTDEEAAAVAAVFAILAMERAGTTAVLEPTASGWSRGATALRPAWPARERWATPFS